MSKKRNLTPGYVFFYLLFLPDTWRVLVGILVSYLLTPSILRHEAGTPAAVMLYVMIATVGYAGSRKPAKAFTRMLKRRILGDRAGE